MSQEFLQIEKTKDKLIINGEEKPLNYFKDVYMLRYWMHDGWDKIFIFSKEFGDVEIQFPRHTELSIVEECFETLGSMMEN